MIVDARKPELVRMPGGGYVVDDELVFPQAERQADPERWNESVRPSGPMRHSPRYRGILSVR
jgi:hypothetical protein